MNVQTTRRGLAALLAVAVIPAAGHFFAYAIRGPVVEMLDPKPLPYQPEGHAVDFGGYLAAPPP